MTFATLSYKSYYKISQTPKYENTKNVPIRYFIIISNLNKKMKKQTKQKTANLTSVVLKLRTATSIEFMIKTIL